MSRPLRTAAGNHLPAHRPTGLLATRHCEEEEVAGFVEGTEPQEGCPDHRSWWTRDRGDETDARDLRFRGLQKKPGFWSRFKNAFGV